MYPSEIFNKLCKGLKKYEVEDNKNNLLNYLKIIDELDINCQNMEDIKLLLEFFLECFGKYRCDWRKTLKG